MDAWGCTPKRGSLSTFGSCTRRTSASARSSLRSTPAGRRAEEERHGEEVRAVHAHHEVGFRAREVLVALLRAPWSLVADAEQIAAGQLGDAGLVERWRGGVGTRSA